MNRAGFNMIRQMFHLLSEKQDRKYRRLCINCKNVLNDLITLEQLEKHIEIQDLERKTKSNYKAVEDKQKNITIKTTKNEFENLLSEVLNELETPKEKTANA